MSDISNKVIFPVLYSQLITYYLRAPPRWKWLVGSALLRSVHQSALAVRDVAPVSYVLSCESEASGATMPGGGAPFSAAQRHSITASPLWNQADGRECEGM